MSPVVSRTNRRGEILWSPIAAFGDQADEVKRLTQPNSDYWDVPYLRLSPWGETLFALVHSSDGITIYLTELGIQHLVTDHGLTDQR